MNKEIQLKTALGIFFPNIMIKSIYKHAQQYMLDQEELISNSELKAKIIDLVDEGKSNDYIRGNFKNYNYMDVARFIYDARCLTGIGLSAEIAEKRRSMLSDFYSGMSIQDMTDKYKYKTCKILKDNLKRFGIDFAAINSHKYEKRNSEIIAFYAKCKSYDEVLKKFNITRSAAYQLIWSAKHGGKKNENKAS